MRGIGIRSGVAVAVLLATLGLASTAAHPAQSERQSFIVVLKPGADPASVADKHAKKHDGKVENVYQHALRGYSATLPPGQAKKLAAEPEVEYVEQDSIATASTTQTSATWGLDRIDQRLLPLSSTYSYNNTGAGVTAYIVDSGVRFDHSQFGGRAFSGTDKIDGGTADDCAGHGTHVAGTVGGATHGVAKGVRLVAVRVLNCSGSGAYSQVIAGLDWVTADHAAGAPAVANMSLGGPVSTALDTAVRNSIADGVSYSLAAGNSSRDACKESPARVGEGMTIGASDSRDRRANFSSWGTCVDWFAPGVSITSAYHTSSTASAVLSGTSMAAPHTAGVAALYLQSNGSASPTSVRTALFNGSTGGIVTNAKSVNNRLLFTSY